MDIQRNASASHENTQIHVVIGAGQVGQQLAAGLLARGRHVRLVRRSSSGANAPRLTWMRGDITDRTFADEACRGASVIYNTANPSNYYAWDSILPPLWSGIREAAARAGARLVVLDNLYMYGAPTEAIHEGTDFAPCSRKGELRARLATELFEAHKRGDVAVCSGRASDYFGPGTLNAAVFGPRFFERLGRGKAVELFGDPDLPRSYSFTPDVARGLAILGEHEVANGTAWILPASQRTGTTRELVEYMAEVAGVSGRSKVVPRWLMSTIAVISPTIRSVMEMLYQWERPFVVDDSLFCRTFQTCATPLGEAAGVTVRAEIPTLHVAEASAA